MLSLTKILKNLQITIMSMIKEQILFRIKLVNGTKMMNDKLLNRHNIINTSLKFKIKQNSNATKYYI